MNRKNRLSIAAAGSALILACGAVTAQNSRRSAPAMMNNPNVSTINPFDPTQPPDPFRSNIPWLVMRPDVRTEIKVTAQQREQLDDLAQRSTQDLRNKALAAAQELRHVYHRPDPSTGVSTQPPAETSEDRNAAIQQRRQELIKSVNDAQQSVEKQIARILRLDQQNRVMQLDLQFRGPLALSDPDVASYLQLTPDQNAAERSVVNGYRMGQVKARQAAMEVINSSPERSNPGRPGGVDPTLMLEAQEIYNRDEAKAKKDAEQKALAVLNPDQAQAWQAMLGPKFMFRTVF